MQKSQISIDARTGDGFTMDNLPRPETEMPYLWVGFLLAFLGCMAEIYVGLSDPLVGLPGWQPPSWLFFSSMIPGFYWLYCVKRFHDAIWTVPGYNHPITPSRAVAFHFLPLFNLYWTFKWPLEVAKFVNWRTQSPAMKGWIAGLLVLLAFLARQVFGSLGLFLLFASGVYVARHMRRAFAAAEVPESALQPPETRGPLGI